jgi:hypothetical protein
MGLELIHQGYRGSRKWVTDPLVPVVVLGGAICQGLQFRTALEYFFNGFL